MKIVIESTKIFSPETEWHLREANVLIEDGIIKEIGSSKFTGDHTINGKGCWLSPGWVDSWAHFNDPGHENKEDIYSGREAAMYGGFTAVAVLPNNKPLTDSKNQVKYLTKGNSTNLTQILPLAAATKGTEGDNLSEMIDLYHSGAVAFTDGEKAIDDAEVLLKSLQYLHKINGLIMQKPVYKSLNNDGSMHEGSKSTKLGLKGNPALNEEVLIQRDLSILEYAGGKLHFINVSSRKSLNLIRKAKNNGLNVSCSIASYQTAFTDEDITPFDTNYKVDPPFRSEKDNKAIIKALKDGTIDLINSNHIPQDIEDKRLEFDLAEFGIISLQTVASDLTRLSQHVEIEKLLSSVSIKPRQLFNMPIPKIASGEIADLTLYSPNKKWVFDKYTNKSKSGNSPFMNKELEGKAIFTIRNKEFVINE